MQGSLGYEPETRSLKIQAGLIQLIFKYPKDEGGIVQNLFSCNYIHINLYSWKKPKPKPEGKKKNT